MLSQNMCIQGPLPPFLQYHLKLTKGILIIVIGFWFSLVTDNKYC